jgi:signal transduction histidine kinase
MTANAVAKVLIVDDDQRSLMALEALLESLQQPLVVASSGEEALRKVLRDDFAVILLDVRMPGIDGFETAKLIRERRQSAHTPIIFLTGASEDLPSMFRGYEAGAVDYIVKPVNPAILKSKIAVFVDLFVKSQALEKEIADHRLAQEQLLESQENLRALTTHLQSVREKEQTRIAREIHDELGQSLTGLKMDLTWLMNRIPQQKLLLSKAKSMSRLIDGTIHSVRRIASGLRPEALDAFGLAAAINWQALEFQKRSGVRCTIQLPPDGPEPDPERATALFRIFQELLTNVARHSNATRVEVQLEITPDSLVLEVRDNGRGVTARETENPRSLGILGMRERALQFEGNVEIDGIPGKGTRVRVAIPFGSSPSVSEVSARS